MTSSWNCKEADWPQHLKEAKTTIVLLRVKRLITGATSKKPLCAAQQSSPGWLMACQQGHQLVVYIVHRVARDVSGQKFWWTYPFVSDEVSAAAFSKGKSVRCMQVVS